MPIYCKDKKKAEVKLPTQSIVSSDCPVRVEVDNQPKEVGKCQCVEMDVYRLLNLTNNQYCPGDRKIGIKWKGYVLTPHFLYKFDDGKQHAFGGAPYGFDYIVVPGMGTDCKSKAETIFDGWYLTRYWNSEPYEHYGNCGTAYYSSNWFEGSSIISMTPVDSKLCRGYSPQAPKLQYQIQVWDSFNSQETPNNKLYDGFIDSPNDYSVVCDDECPPGYLKCASDAYPGYCCVPCDSFKSRISNLTSYVKGLDNG